MARHAKLSRARSRKRLQGPKKSEWGLLPLLLVLIVLTLIILSMTDIHLPHSPLLAGRPR